MTNKVLSEEPILEKVALLKAKLSGADISDQMTVNQWEAMVKEALITNSLKKHEGIQMIIAKAVSDIKDINDVLQNAKSKDLSESDRNSMIDVKEFYKWFINLFEVSANQLESIEKEIDGQLK